MNFCRLFVFYPDLRFDVDPLFAATEQFVAKTTRRRRILLSVKGQGCDVMLGLVDSGGGRGGGAVVIDV